MLDRLKSLPLTVALTLLIWLYAESQVRTEAPNETTVQIGDVPVWVAGPPDIINQNDVIVEPRFVTVEVTGTKQALANVDRGRISAFLDIETEDLRASQATPEQKTLRVICPPDLRVATPPEVKFYFREKTRTPSR